MKYENCFGTKIFHLSYITENVKYKCNNKILVGISWKFHFILVKLSLYETFHFKFFTENALFE